MKAIVYSRCSGCGLWVLDTHGQQMEEEFVCVDCLHEGVDLQIEEFANDPVHAMLPPEEWFK